MMPEKEGGTSKGRSLIRCTTNFAQVRLASASSTLDVSLASIFALCLRVHYVFSACAQRVHVSRDSSLSVRAV